MICSEYKRHSILIFDSIRKLQCVHKKISNTQYKDTFFGHTVAKENVHTVYTLVS